MALPDKALLRPELLYLFVLGPRTGETVLLRLPPGDRWVVIDSFRCATPKRPAAEHVLSHYGGQVDCLVLTHPHEDHAVGMIDLIERYPNAKLACVHPCESIDNGVATDATSLLHTDISKRTFVRIWKEWQLAPLTRPWRTFRGEVQTFQDVRFTALNPPRPLTSEAWKTNHNRLSSAMLVEWRDVRVLLGADVPSTEWPAISAAYPDLGVHSAMKVPHHGSQNAIHESYGLGPDDRLWIITPYSGKKKLPSAEDASLDGRPEGLARVLSFVPEVHLTALPFAHNSEMDTPCDTDRASLKTKTHPLPTGLRDETLLDGLGALDRHVIVGFDEDGTIQQVIHGSGSVRVRP